jgi:DNA replication and repair protein RecF
LVFGLFQAIEFLQQDSDILFGEPEGRRRLLDIACSLHMPSYYKNLLHYNRALKQRNQQIKTDIERNTADRHIWNEALIRYGSAIIRSRRNMATLLENYTRERARKMGIAELDLRFLYKSLQEKGEETLEECFEKNLYASVKREEVFKTTVLGPHRDNFIFLNHGRDMRDFSSQGQVRMTIIATKLALAEFLHEERGIHPVFLFDDVLLEIDPQNTESILKSFGGQNQMFFTSTVRPEFDFFKRLPGEYFYRLAEGGQICHE